MTTKQGCLDFKSGRGEGKAALLKINYDFGLGLCQAWLKLDVEIR